MEENAFDKLKSMLNNGNIPDELQNIISNMNSSSNKNADSSNVNNGISSEAISNLMSMFNSKTDNSDDSSSNIGIDFETIMKLKSIMDRMNSKDDPRSKLLTSLRPYLKESRKSKLDQYIQFLNMSKVIDIFSKQNGDSK